VRRALRLINDRPGKKSASEDPLQTLLDATSDSAIAPVTESGGETPNEVYYHKRPANRNPRIEP
jgi:hypothetical protein